MEQQTITADTIQIQLNDRVNTNNQIMITISGTTQQELIEKYNNIKQNVLPDWVRR